MNEQRNIRYVSIVTTIHFVLGFLVLLCALAFSWNALGRRVMNAVVGLQFLCGLVLAGTYGMQHVPLPARIWEHAGLALVALIAYGMAMVFGKRPGGGRIALALSIVGLLCVCVAVYLGLHMAGQA